MSAMSSPAQDWTHHPERGSLPLVRFMAWVSLALGRRASRVLLRIIALYFFATAANARRAARDYLRRCLRREPTLAERHALFLNFASTVHDRVYFLKDRFEPFEITTQGTAAVDQGSGVLLGAHFGSFEALRSLGRLHGRTDVFMAMYEENARRLNGVLAAINPEATRAIVALGHLGSMLALRDRLDEGALVGVLADRTLGDEPVIRVPFLGEPAAFPTGPMRMAAALRQRVIFMAATYEGGNRYEITFEPLADFTNLADVSRAERSRLVNMAVERYVERLEFHCRRSPGNWFNFHDFWKRP